jgi:hypothetical protein
VNKFLLNNWAQVLQPKDTAEADLKLVRDLDEALFILGILDSFLSVSSFSMLNLSCHIVYVFTEAQQRRVLPQKTQMKGRPIISMLWSGKFVFLEQLFQDWGIKFDQYWMI